MSKISKIAKFAIKLPKNNFKMPAFTLHGSRGSTNTDRVRLTLAEGGFTDYELVLVNIQKGEQKVGATFFLIIVVSCPPQSAVHRSVTIWKLTLLLQSKEHMNRHPWGKIPSITTPSGFTLYESRPICKYLATKYSFPLVPPASDVEAVALFDQAQSVESFYFAEPAGRIGFEKFVKPFRGLTPDENVIADALKSLENFFDVAEGLLKQREYMAGNEFSLVDILLHSAHPETFCCWVWRSHYRT